MSAGPYTDLVAQVRALWGENLRPARPESLPPVLSEPIRHFLVTVGLPAELPWDVTLVSDRPVLESVRVNGRDLVVLGDDHGALIAVDAVAGSVWAVSSGAGRSLCLFNSSLPLFLVVLGRVGRLLDQVAAASPEQGRRLVAAMREELSVLDPPSMARGATQWPDYLDEVAG